jgi:hypothetical protein
MARRLKGGGKPAETGDGKTAIKVAFIGGAATLLAAIIGGLFVLFSGTGGGNSTSGGPANNPESVILAVSFAQTQAKETVIVKGEAQDIPTGEAVYAVATPENINATPAVAGQTVAQSWFVGGPADIRQNGLWVIQIDIAPPTSQTLTIVAVITDTVVSAHAAGNCGSSPCPPPTTNLTTLSPAEIRSNLEANGPASGIVMSMSSAVHPRPGH